MNPIDQHILDQVALDQQQRLLRFKRAWDAYYGRFQKPLRVRPGQPDDNLRLNFSRVIVDTGVSFLFGKPVDFELDEQQETPAEEWLERVWKKNKQMTLLQKLALNGGVCGQPFVKIVLGSPITAPYPRLIVLDPANVTPDCDGDDFEDICGYTIQYTDIDRATGRPITCRQRIARVVDALGAPLRWQLTDQVKGGSDRDWRTVKETVWPYPFAPIAHCQNLPAANEFWGISDLEDDVLEANKGLIFIISNLSRIVRVHGHPKPWARGMGGNKIETAVDEMILLPTKDGELGLLQAENLDNGSIELYKRVKEALHEISRTPEVATGKLDNIGQLSGLAIQILYGPLMSKTETKRTLYGELLAELNRRLLVIGGHGAYDDDALTTTIHWQDPLPQDPLAERQAALLDEQLGASKHTLLTTLGYNAEAEAKKKAKEQADHAEVAMRQFDRGQVTGAEDLGGAPDEAADD